MKRLIIHIECMAAILKLHSGQRKEGNMCFGIGGLAMKSIDAAQPNLLSGLIINLVLPTV